MIEISVQVENKDEIQKYLRDLPENSFKAARKVFAQAVLAADKETKQNATEVLNVRTGALRRSISNEVVGFDLDNLRASIFSGATGESAAVVYAPIHEYGGTIRAKKAFSRVPGGPYLSIPIADNLTGAGVMRMTPTMVFNQGGNLVKSRRGNWVVLLGDKLMFVLKKQVTIKPRLGMNKAAENQVTFLMTSLAELIGED